MRHTDQKRRIGIAAAGTAALLLFLAMRYRFCFDLNDDVLMKDILSGAYTGVPESRNIQMLYPVSALIATLYRIAGLLPAALQTVHGGGVYGTFLIGCQMVSVAAVTYCLMKRDPDRRLVCAGLFFPLSAAALCLKGLVILQYTVTTGFLCLAAGVLFISGRRKTALVFAGLSFAVRSEMTLLLTPMLLLLIFTAEWIAAQGTGFIGKLRRAMSAALKALALFAVLFAVIKALDSIALSGRDWRTFTHLFDERTRLYDYYLAELPEYDEDPAFFDGIGVSRVQAELFNNYNFGLDARIDDRMMETVADRAREDYSRTHSFPQEMRKALSSYKYMLTHLTDGAPAILIAVLYVLAAVTGLKRAAFPLVILAAGRSTIWVYLLYRRRVPERITAGLYLMEAGILLVILTACAAKKQLYAVLLAALCVVLTGKGDGPLSEELARRQTVNRGYEAYLDYCAAHPDRFLFTDVYSTVAYSEDVYGRRILPVRPSGVPDNHDIMGGWASKSPLYDRKLAAFGFASMEEALTEDSRCLFAAAPDRDTAWLAAYYAEKGIPISIREYDKIEEVFTVYEIIREDLE